jgi:formate dehydrogenase subunit gamma
MTMNPAMTEDAIPDDSPDRTARQVCAQFHHRPDALIDILRSIQERLGYIPDAAVPALADALNLSRADVHGVVTFYHDFHRQPGGRHRLKICRAEACQSMQGEQVAHLVEERLGIRFGETTGDGRITLETVYCLGNCALAPAAMLDDRLVGRFDADRLEGLIRACGEVNQ